MAVAFGQHLIQSFGNCAVGGHAAYKIDRLVKRPFFKRATPCGRCFRRGHIAWLLPKRLFAADGSGRFWQKRCSGRRCGERCPEFQSQRAKVFDLDTQAVGLLFQKTAGAGGAQRIGSHLPGLFQAILQFNYQRTLPADLNNGSGFRIIMQEARKLSPENCCIQSSEIRGEPQLYRNQTCQ